MSISSIIIISVGIAVVFLIMAQVSYRLMSHGLSSSAIHQQTTRFAVASVMAVAPAAIVACVNHAFPPFAPQLIMAAATSLLWAIAYPLLYHISNRSVSSDYDFNMDIACGLYFYGALSALVFCGAAFPAISLPTSLLLSLAEFLILFMVLFQLVYFALYRTCIDSAGMSILQDTHVNEVFEFCRSYPWYVTALTVLAIFVFGAAPLLVNLLYPLYLSAAGWLAIIMAVVFIAMVIFIFAGKRCPFYRCGFVALFRTVREYNLSNRRYARCRAERIKDLKVTPLGVPWSKPSTIVMVIGESASRDFMSAFTPVEQLDGRQSTPWLDALAADTAHTILYPNAYACAMHTVAVLEKALTEATYYNDKPFFDSCSVIDIARALGYRIHWYSNQGHLGSFDTPVTLVADTADVAKWTKQQLNKLQYDMSMLDFIDELDPAQNNFLVLHLKGSHFSYLNRYPESETVWGEPGVQDNIPNYLNSLHYTDKFLKSVFEKCRERLNMQAMVYFSDHGSIPSRRRTPGFDGFGHVRIPMFTWFSDEYTQAHPVPFEALLANRKRYFTNDLAYDLMCGIFDVESNRYDPTQSLASSSYRFTREDLLTFEGKIRVVDDPFSQA